MKRGFNNILEAIGKMPLIRLKNMAKDIKSVIYVKLECLNTGVVKMLWSLKFITCVIIKYVIFLKIREET